MDRSFVVAILASTVLAVSASLVVAAIAGMASPENRVGAARAARVALFLGFAAVYACARTRGRPSLLAACGFAPLRRPVASYVLGFAAGVVPIVILVVGLVAAGARSVEVRGSLLKLAGYAAKFILLGLPLVAIEEGLFRGLILGDLVRRLGRAGGIAATSLFFAATHFLGPPDAWRKDARPVEGPADTVIAVFAGTQRLLSEWPEFVGLALVGVVLAALRLRAGHVYLAMGVHAGWYFVKQMDRYFVHEVDAVVARHRLLIGSEQYLDGVVGWAALLLSLVLALTMPLPASPGSRTS